MSMLSSQCERLRRLAGIARGYAEADARENGRALLFESAEAMREAADTIESLRDRLQAVNDDCEYCNNGKKGFDGQKAMMSNHGWQTIRHCPNCGKRLVDE